MKSFLWFSFGKWNELKMKASDVLVLKFLAWFSMVVCYSFSSLVFLVFSYIYIYLMFLLFVVVVYRL